MLEASFTLSNDPFAGLVTRWGALDYDDTVLGFQIWRLITYQFIHAGFWHIFSNMLILYFFGPMVERWLGSKRFIYFYLISGIGAGAVYLMLSLLGSIFPENVPFLVPSYDDRILPLVGASGCVFGVLVACLRYAPDATVLLFFVLPIKLKIIVWFALLVNLYSAMVGDGSSVAHLGGAAAGALLIWKPGLLDFFAKRTRSLDEIRDTLDERKATKQKQKTADLEKEIDRILAKVHDQGMHSLTKREKQTLRQATETKRGG